MCCRLEGVMSGAWGELAGYSAFYHHTIRQAAPPTFLHKWFTSIQ